MVKWGTQRQATSNLHFPKKTRWTRSGLAFIKSGPAAVVPFVETGGPGQDLQARLSSHYASATACRQSSNGTNKHQPHRYVVTN